MNHTASLGTARHPFRATLPLRILRRLPRLEPEVRARMASAGAALETADKPAAGTSARPLVTVQDVKDFLLAYCACFIGISAYLS